MGTGLATEAGAPVFLCFLGADDAAVDFPLALSDLVLIGLSSHRKFLEQICFFFDEICQPVDMGHFKSKLGDCLGSSSDISFLFSAMLDVCSVAFPVVFIDRLF